MTRAVALASLLLLLAVSCGDGGSATLGGKTQPPRQDDEAVADAIAASVGKQAYCYEVGTVLFRGARTSVFQCELGATGDVNCYVRPGRKPILVDDLLVRKEFYKSLESSDPEELACVDVSK
jgi:hypothetical protein